MRHSRQEFLIDTERIKTQKVLVVGVGAVGKETATTLAANGVGNIHICDFDTVEEHNQVTQGYFTEHIGQPKVECVADIMSKIDPSCNITIINDKWRPDHDEVYNAVFLSVDSLDTREKIFNWFENKTQFIGDVRVGGEQIDMFSINDDESKRYYRTTLTGDSSVQNMTGTCHDPMVMHSAKIGSAKVVQQYIANLFKSGRVVSHRSELLPSCELLIKEK